CSTALASWQPLPLPAGAPPPPAGPAPFPAGAAHETSPRPSGTPRRWRRREMAELDVGRHCQLEHCRQRGDRGGPHPLVLRRAGRRVRAGRGAGRSVRRRGGRSPGGRDLRTRAVPQDVPCRARLGLRVRLAEQRRPLLSQGRGERDAEVPSARLVPPLLRWAKRFSNVFFVCPLLVCQAKELGEASFSPGFPELLGRGASGEKALSFNQKGVDPQAGSRDHLCSLQLCHSLILVIVGLTNFLPFVCDGCSGIFCLEHRSRESHGCPEVTVINERLKSDKRTSHPCLFKACAERELVPVMCPYCEKNFCLRHRHQSDHECEKLEIPKPRMAATQKLVKDIIGKYLESLFCYFLTAVYSVSSRAPVSYVSLPVMDGLINSPDDSKTGETASKRRKGAKNSETAAKVALMKLKMHAVGDKSLPQTERIYFQVFLPKGSREKSKPMFFCRRWSVGKAVDFAASLASLKNDNNRLTAKKLRLCHLISGEALPLDHTLETWIAKEDCPLYNGGSVILEYLNDEEQLLENVDSYLE
ncbi:hypothetical protein HPG69_011486, partial [Diceros bicornis minor]